MEYNNQQQLYQVLKPVFDVKMRLLSITKYNDITKEDIWKYLASTKWRLSTNLTIADIVNDIIIVDKFELVKYKGGTL